MAKRTLCIILSVIVAAAVAAGLGVLIWWLVAGRGDEFSVIILENDGVGDVPQQAAFTRITGTGDMFWWFYPTIATAATTRPILLWLDGVTGLPPSLLANFGMFGPYDFNIDRRTDSWIDEYNLLFVDAPIGTGFSTAIEDQDIPENLDENTNHLLFTLEAFYSIHEEYKDAPLYIFGQGHGAQMALSLALRLDRLIQDGNQRYTHNFQGIVLANGIIAPSLTLTKLGFYLDEMGYISPRERVVVEEFSTNITTLMSSGDFQGAYDYFLILGEFINEVGAVAVNLNNIIEKLTREPAPTTDYFRQRKHLRDISRTDVDFNEFMERIVGPALGISGPYDEKREVAVHAVRDTFMVPAVELVEQFLNNTQRTVAIYNGNLDAISNTPGQLEWIYNLRWPGQYAFLNTPRRALILNGHLHGHFRETERLNFYWMNAAGQSVPLDSPLAMRRVLQLMTNTNPT